MVANLVCSSADWEVEDLPEDEEEVKKKRRRRMKKKRMKTAGADSFNPNLDANGADSGTLMLQPV